MFGTNLIKTQPVTDMVDRYTEATALIERAYLDLEKARRLLSDTFGEQAYIHVADRQHLEFGEKGYVHIRREIKKRVWIRQATMGSAVSWWIGSTGSGWCISGCSGTTPKTEK